MALKTPLPIGANIRAIRERRGLTQLELAHAMGYTGDSAFASISRMESDKIIPTIPTLQRLAEVLKVDMGMFLRAEEVEK